KRFGQTKKYVLALPGPCQVKLRATLHYLAAMLDELLEYALERKRLRHPVYQHNHVEMEGVFKRGVLIQIVEHLLRVCTLFEVDDNGNVAGRFIAQAAYALKLLLPDEVGYPHDEVGLVDTVWDRGNDDLKVAFFALDNLRVAAHHHSPFAGRVGVQQIFFIKR